MPSSERRILLVEDNTDLAQLLSVHLRDLAFDVSVAEDGPTALERARRERFDLLILDLMLPGLDGLEVCRRLRASASPVPILMLTARSTELDRVIGLETGADDYLTKPFSITELLARVKALFRRLEHLARHGAAAESGSLELDGLVIDIARRSVRVEDRPVQLTAKEFDLLVHLARHPGRVFSRAELLDQVWGHGFDGYEHTVNSHINRLRVKVEADPARPRFVRTVWGVGYKLADRDELRNPEPCRAR